MRIGTFGYPNGGIQANVSVVWKLKFPGYLRIVVLISEVTFYGFSCLYFLRDGWNKFHPSRLGKCIAPSVSGFYLLRFVT